MDTKQKPVALITGGSRGIGLGCAEALARSGFDLAINGMRAPEAVSDVLQHLQALGAEVRYCRGDIGSDADRMNILDAVREGFGRLNVLVNNAGVAPKERSDILDTTDESYDRVLETNLKGAFFLTQSAAKWMVAQREAAPDFAGSIINVGSISATVASVNRAEYCIAKAGLAMMTQLFAARLGEVGIPVFEVRPGITRTDMTAGVAEKYDRLIADGLTVTPRWGLPEDVGRVVAALARGEFAYSTGAAIPIDGGLTLQRL